MTDEFVKLLDQGCADLEIELSDQQKEQFFKYYEMMIEKNKVMNLTAITELSDVITKHFVDSLLLVLAAPELGLKLDGSAEYSCIDVGTGAGFPGIPLKIAFPWLKITLLDSLNKRVGFLNEVIEALGLTDITAVHGRAEDYGRDAKYREQYDICVSRAVANMSTLSEYCIPFVKKGGYFIPYKSGKADEEIAQAISVIFLFNVIAALIFPTLGGVLGLSNEGFGLFAGTAVNDTSSVTAAAAAWDGMHPGANTLDTAAIVKMTRTLAIIPITLVLALLRTRREGKQGGAQVDIKKIFPWFVLLFLLASIITTVLPIPAAAVSFLKNASKFFIVMAMAAIGLNTDIVKLVKTGGKPIFMGFCCWVAIAGVSLLVQHLLGIW